MFEGDVFEFDAKMQPLLKIMCDEIAKQKRRLGGDFAVAHAVVSRYVACCIQLNTPTCVLQCKQVKKFLMLDE